jgi:hypothetical protein
VTGADAGRGVERRAGPLAVARAVLAAFVGIRKRAAYERDAQTITPVQAVVAGLAGAALLVTALLLLVRFITG